MKNRSNPSFAAGSVKRAWGASLSVQIALHLRGQPRPRRGVAGDHRGVGAGVEHRPQAYAVDRDVGVGVIVLRAALQFFHGVVRHALSPIGQNRSPAVDRPQQANHAVGKVVIVVREVQEVLTEQPGRSVCALANDQEFYPGQGNACEGQGLDRRNAHVGRIAADAGDEEPKWGLLQTQAELSRLGGGDSAEKGAAVEREGGVLPFDLHRGPRRHPVHGDRKFGRLPELAGGRRFSGRKQDQRRQCANNTEHPHRRLPQPA